MKAVRKPSNRARATKDARQLPKHEAEIVTLCVKYARLAAGFNNGFKADPTGDNTFANNGDLAGVHKTLNALAMLSAETPIGLCAKARIVPMVFEIDRYYLEASSVVFFESFAQDVRNFMQPLCDAEWKKSASDRQSAHAQLGGAA